MINAKNAAGEKYNIVTLPKDGYMVERIVIIGHKTSTETSISYETPSTRTTVISKQ